jgi:hypothetical protein
VPDGWAATASEPAVPARWILRVQARQCGVLKLSGPAFAGDEPLGISPGPLFTNWMTVKCSGAS